MLAPANKKATESKARYIWKVGILCWALPLYVLFMVIEIFVVRYHHPMDFTLPNMLEIAAFALMVWLITGWIFGAIVWRRRQKTFLKQRQ